MLLHQEKIAFDLVALASMHFQCKFAHIQSRQMHWIRIPRLTFPRPDAMSNELFDSLGRNRCQRQFILSHDWHFSQATNE